METSLAVTVGAILYLLAAVTLLGVCRAIRPDLPMPVVAAAMWPVLLLLVWKQAGAERERRRARRVLWEKADDLYPASRSASPQATPPESR